MKIAVVSDNGTTISRHFGRARQYVVVSIENGQVVEREIREKSDSHSEPTAGETHEGQATGDPRHDAILSAISDCQVVITAVMGMGMDVRLRAAGITPIRTLTPGVDLAIEKFLSGRLNDMIDLVH